MTESNLIGAIVALWGSAVAMAGLIYRIEEARIAEWKNRAERLEVETRAAMAARDEELHEWRQIALRGLTHQA